MTLIRLCHGTGDGIVIKTRFPFRTEVGAARTNYMNRKGTPGIVVQAFVSAELEFLFVSAKLSGSTHDWIAYSCTSLAEAIATNQLPQQYFMVADAAYVCSEQLLTPWPGNDLSPAQDAFNYHLSLM